MNPSVNSRKALSTNKDKIPRESHFNKLRVTDGRYIELVEV